MSRRRSTIEESNNGLRGSSPSRFAIQTSGGQECGSEPLTPPLRHYCFRFDEVMEVKDISFLGLKWVVQGEIDVDIGAHPSIEGSEDIRKCWKRIRFETSSINTIKVDVLAYIISSTPTLSSSLRFLSLLPPSFHFLPSHNINNTNRTLEATFPHRLGVSFSYFPPLSDLNHNPPLPIPISQRRSRFSTPSPPLHPSFLNNSLHSTPALR
ncbi:hypothetical protein VNO80_22799 [Phaseolus coccineus]|uniref:Uncharacterized protein n=1 Tax=Phaseolus coccineus TaxID=3886 RepID=A0AAN9MBA5_PHACN